MTAYYGRVGQENRFYQEDCELGLDRIFSYSPWGQQLANLIGLFVWNWRTSRGSELCAPMPATATQQPPRQVNDVEPDDGFDSKPSNPAVTCSDTGEPKYEPPQLEHTTTIGAGIDEANETIAPVSSDSDESTSEATPTENTVPIEKHPTHTTENSNVVASKDEQLALLGTADWEALLETTPQWHWNHKEGLLCPDNSVMRLHELRTQMNGDVLVRFRARISACQACSIRSSCTTSDSARFKKERGFAIHRGDIEQFERLRANAAPINTQRDQSSSNQGKRQASPPLWWPIAPETQYGPHHVSWPSLVPAALKDVFATASDGIEIHVSVDRPGRPRLKKLPSYLAPTPADRQQRRKSWTWRANRNALPDRASVDIEMRGASRRLAILSSQGDEANQDAA